MAWLAYFTSNMVTLVNSMNRQEEYARAKIGRVALFCRHAGISHDLNQRVKARRPPHFPTFLFHALVLPPGPHVSPASTKPPLLLVLSLPLPSPLPSSSTPHSTSSPRDRQKHLEHVMLRKKLDLDTNELLAELSSPLRGEVALQRCHAFLFNPKFAAILGFDSSDATGSMGQAMFIKELVRRLRLEVLSPGDFAVEEGEVGHSIHFLSKGNVAVIAGKGQDSFQVASLSSGDCFGEIALLVRFPQSPFPPATLAPSLYLAPCLSPASSLLFPSPQTRPRSLPLDARHTLHGEHRRRQLL